MLLCHCGTRDKTLIELRIAGEMGWTTTTPLILWKGKAHPLSVRLENILFSGCDEGVIVSSRRRRRRSEKRQLNKVWPHLHLQHPQCKFLLFAYDPPFSSFLAFFVAMGNRTSFVLCFFARYLSQQNTSSRFFSPFLQRSLSRHFKLEPLWEFEESCPKILYHKDRVTVALHIY